MRQNTDEPRIYVACLASYNAARLHGEWIQATQGAEEIRAEIRAMLAASPEPGAEEYVIHDVDNFGGLQLHEFESLEHVVRAAKLIKLHRNLAAVVIDYYGGLSHLDEAEQALMEHFAGSFDDREEWGQHVLEESGDLRRIPEHLRSFINLERYAQSLANSGDFVVLEFKRKEPEPRSSCLRTARSRFTCLFVHLFVQSNRLLP